MPGARPTYYNVELTMGRALAWAPVEAAGMLYVSREREVGAEIREAKDTRTEAQQIQ